MATINAPHQLSLPLHRTFRVPMHTFTPDAQTLFEVSHVCFSDLPDIADAHTQPLFGHNECPSHSIYEYVTWFYDGDESAFSFI